jgi:hypothetical protein
LAHGKTLVLKSSLCQDSAWASHKQTNKQTNKQLKSFAAKPAVDRHLHVEPVVELDEPHEEDVAGEDEEAHHGGQQRLPGVNVIHPFRPQSKAESGSNIGVYIRLFGAI